MRRHGFVEGLPSFHPDGYGGGCLVVRHSSQSWRILVHQDTCSMSSQGGVYAYMSTGGHHQSVIDSKRIEIHWNPKNFEAHGNQRIREPCRGLVQTQLAYSDL